CAGARGVVTRPRRRRLIEQVQERAPLPRLRHGLGRHPAAPAPGPPATTSAAAATRPAACGRPPRGAAGNNSIPASGSQVATSGQAAVSVNAPLAGLTINGGCGNNQITVSNLTLPVQSLALNGAGTGNTFTLVNAGTNVGSLAVKGGGSGGNQAPHLAPLVSA